MQANPFVAQLDQVAGLSEGDVMGVFRVQIIRYITLTASLAVVPFTLNNLFQGRVLVGVIALMVVAVLVENACSHARGRRGSLPLSCLVPAVTGFLAVCFQKQGIIGALWSFPAVLLFYFVLPRRQALWANALLLLVAVPSAFSVLSAALAARVLATLVAASIMSGIFVTIIAAQQQKLREMAAVDPLTGVLNRLQLKRTLDSAYQQFRRYQNPVSLISLDIDRFKSINDTYGHAAGDEVLRSVAARLKRRLRATDEIFRTGGEEFLILLTNTARPAAREVAESLRRLVAEGDILAQQRVTVSIGVAELQPGEGMLDCLERSDERLYQAKDSGRNCVVSSP